jgi:hypothetical protein
VQAERHGDPGKPVENQINAAESFVDDEISPLR